METTTTTNGPRRGDFSNISQTLSLVLDKLALLMLLLLLLPLQQRTNERETFAYRPVVEIGEVFSSSAYYNMDGCVCVCRVHMCM